MCNNHTIAITIYIFPNKKVKSNIEAYIRRKKRYGLLPKSIIGNYKPAPNRETLFKEVPAYRRKTQKVLKKPSDEPYQDTPTFPETAKASLHESESCNNLLSFNTSWSCMFLLIYVFDIDLGPNINRVDVLDLICLQRIRHCNMTKI